MRHLYSTPNPILRNRVVLAIVRSNHVHACPSPGPPVLFALYTKWACRSLYPEWCMSHRVRFFSVHRVICRGLIPARLLTTVIPTMYFTNARRYPKGHDPAGRAHLSGFFRKFLRTRKDA